MKDAQPVNSLYKVSCYVSASEMETEITATVSVDGVTVETEKYSVADYLDVILNDSAFADNYTAKEGAQQSSTSPKLVNTVKALYGYYMAASEFFN